MRICLANSALHCGGAERALSELANHLVARGYDVTIFLLFKKPIFYTIDPRVKIVEPGFSRETMNKYLYGFRTIGYIRKTLRQINPDVILDFFFPSFFMLCTAGLPFPTYISIRNNPANKIPLDPFWLRRLSYKWSKGIIAQTEYAARLTYQQVHHPNIKVIPNFIRAVIEKNVVPQNNIVTVGRLVKGKGHSDLLEIFASLKRPGWKLVIAGDGPLRESLEQQAARLGITDQTVFAGFQPDIDLVLQQAKIFAFCSYSEGFPNALLEAMATPLPCISYNCNAGPADVIKDGKNGFLIPVGNKEMFAQQLLRLMDDEKLRTDVANESAISIKEFGSDRLFQSYIDFLAQKNNGKRILFFNVLPFPHSIDIHEQLMQDGYTIDFWYLKDSSEIYPWRKLDKKVNYRIYKPGIGNFFSLIRSAWKSQLVVITGWNSRMHILLALFCRLFAIKYTFWLDVPEAPKPGFITKVKQWFVRNASGLFISGKTGIDFFVKYFKAKPSKCYNFPYLEVKNTGPGLEEVNRKRNAAILNGDKIRLLLSNRFLKRKGYSTVLTALRSLPADQLAQLDITILGIGVEKELYEKEFTSLGNNVRLRGWVEYTDYLKILEESDIFIHASSHEPYGIPPMDAMRYGKLVIGSMGVMSCVDRIEHGVNGYTFGINNAQELAAVLSELISDKSLIYKKGKAAQLTSSEYGYTYNVKAIEALLR